MNNGKCPFCGEPRLRNSGGEDLFTCGTRGPDINGDYDTGHTCDIHTWSRVLAENDAEIERLRKVICDFVGQGQHYVNYETSPEWRSMLAEANRTRGKG